MGSQLETQVNVQFAYQPTPTQMDVEEKVASILQQSDKLQKYLVPNVTALAVDDPELANLNAI